MFFILSKVLLYFLNPFNWILICLLFVFITKKPIVKKRLLITIGCIFLLFSNYWLYSVCVRAWQPKVEHATYNKSYSTGILLCGMTLNDKQEGRFFGGESDRFIQACRLYHQGIIKNIFISGGSGSLVQDISKEADFLKKEFAAQGIPDSALVIEHDSRNTYESAVLAKRYFDSLKMKPPYILITSAVHMPRSLLTFEKAGLQVLPHPTSFGVVNSRAGFVDYVLPNIGVMAWWKSFLKEVVGTWVYKATGKA